MKSKAWQSESFNAKDVMFQCLRDIQSITQTCKTWNYRKSGKPGVLIFLPLANNIASKSTRGHRCQHTKIFQVHNFAMSLFIVLIYRVIFHQVSWKFEPYLQINITIFNGQHDRLSQIRKHHQLKHFSSVTIHYNILKRM